MDVWRRDIGPIVRCLVEAIESDENATVDDVADSCYAYFTCEFYVVRLQLHTDFERIFVRHLQMSEINMRVWLAICKRHYLPLN